MPQRPSAAKKLRQDARRRLRNKAVKSRLRTEQNKFDRMVGRGELDEARKQFDLLVKLYHRAAARNLIHPNKAARKQAQFQKTLNEIEAQSG